MADEEKAKQSLSGVRFGTKHSYDDFGLVLQKKDLSLPEPKTELKNQIISLSYYAGVPHYQIQELKEKYGIK